MNTEITMIPCSGYVAGWKGTSKTVPVVAVVMSRTLGLPTETCAAYLDETGKLQPVAGGMYVKAVA